MTDTTRQRKQVRQSVAPVAKHGRRQEKGFAAETAALTGESLRSIQRHLARAEVLGDDLERLTGTSLDKGTELDALIRLPEAARKELIYRAAAGEKVSAVAGTRAATDGRSLVVNLSAKSLPELHRKLSRAIAIVELHMGKK